MSENNITKEAILQRMYNHAASFWGVKSIDELDPVVRILMEGLAGNLYETNQNIQDSSIRILESIASALTPSVLISARPAHAIMQALPVESSYYIDPYTAFNEKQPNQELLKQGIRTVSFAPVSKIKLVSGSVKYLVCERMLYSTQGGYDKTLLATAYPLDERINQTLWMGIDLHKEVDSLKHISFYFDFPHADNKYEKYSLIPYSKWSMDGIAVETSPGLPVFEDEDAPKTRSVFDKYDLLNRIDSDILGFYRLQFLTVTSDIRLLGKHKTSFPEAIKDIFPANITDTLEPCFWIKVVFPPHILALNIHDITVNMNAFPVANKILYSITSPPNNVTHIVPLKTGKSEFFLSVDKVEDSYGYIYHSIPYETGMGGEQGIYTVKEGGLERFDGRDLKDYFERLIDYLHSETSLFRSMNMDNIRGSISDLQTGIATIENKYSNSKMTMLEKPRYLIMNTLNKKDIAFIRYWTTLCEQANGIRSGKKFAPAASIPVVNESCQLLKMSSGGKSAPSVTGRLNAYRYALTSHDQLFTHADISNFCEYELGEKIRKVEVKRGIAVSAKPKEGLVRTIDIYLTPSSGCESLVAEMQTELLTRLNQKSPDSFNYRIIIEVRS
jgi:hypothetical protein